MLERSQRIVVAVRKLVHEKHELQPDSESIIVKDNHTVLAIEQQSTAIIPLRKTEKKPLSTITFDFDHAYDSNCTSEKVYCSKRRSTNPLSGRWSNSQERAGRPYALFTGRQQAKHLIRTVKSNWQRCTKWQSKTFSKAK